MIIGDKTMKKYEVMGKDEAIKPLIVAHLEKYKDEFVDIEKKIGYIIQGIEEATHYAYKAAKKALEN